jgi:hypothetical protein
MYTNASLVRNLTPLLTTEAIATDKIVEFIFQAESIINMGLAKRYATPIVRDNLTGTISTTTNNATVTGSGTAFLTELLPGDVIQVGKTKEAIRVLSIASNTSLTGSSAGAVDYSTSGSNFFVIPREIVTVSTYYTAMLIILAHFSEQAYNQQTGQFVTQYNMIAEPLLKEIVAGDYLNTDLTEQTATKNAKRYITVNTSSDIRSFVNDAEDLIIESFQGV